MLDARKKKWGKTLITLILSFVILFQWDTAIAQELEISDFADFQDKIVENMENRKTRFTINYIGDTQKLLSEVETIIKEAYETDDYLRWSWTDINAKIKGVEGNVDVIFSMSYVSTKKQEEYVDQKVKEIISKIITKGMSDKKKAAAIHKYIISHVQYDYTLKERSAYSALAKGKTICQGYSMLMDKMLEEVGIESKIITGNIPAGLHAWNMAKVNGKWYHIDCTNDAANSNSNKYFLVSDNILIKNNYTWEKTEYPKAVYSKAVKLSSK